MTKDDESAVLPPLEGAEAQKIAADRAGLQEFSSKNSSTLDTVLDALKQFGGKGGALAAANFLSGTASDALGGLNNAIGYNIKSEDQMHVFDSPESRRREIDIAQKIDRTSGEVGDTATKVGAESTKEYKRLSDKVEKEADYQVTEAKSAAQDLQTATANFNTAVTDINTQLGENAKRAVIDPHRWIREPSKNGEIGEISMSRSTMAIIAAALGGFASGFSGGENTALKVISQAIDRDIKSQQASFENSVTELGQRMGITQSQFDNAKVGTALRLQAISSVSTATSSYVQAMAFLDKSITSNLLAKQIQQQSQLDSLTAHNTLLSIGGGLSAQGESGRLNTLGLLMRGVGLNVFPHESNLQPGNSSVERYRVPNAEPVWPGEPTWELP